MSSGYVVYCQSTNTYYTGNGTFDATMPIYGSQFSSLADAQSAASTLNSSGYCNGQCKAQTWWDDRSPPPPHCLATQILVDTMGFSDDSDEMKSLRDLRTSLSSTELGLALIEDYEKVSAEIGKLINLSHEKEAILVEIAKSSILKIAKEAKNTEFELVAEEWRSLRSNLEKKIGLSQR